MSLFTPTSIAVIGASATEGKVGHDILKNLLTQGYEGTVTPVNPKGGDILGVKVATTVGEISPAPELAIIVIPAALVAQALQECGEAGVRSAIVISAGFGEVHTEEGTKRERELIEIARQYDIQLIGPNCLGIVRPSSRMNASFAKDIPPAGGIGLISQSGAMGVALMDASAQEGLGISTFVSIGNKAAMDECDLLQMLADDEETQVIGLYLESVKRGRAFLKTALQVTAKKPVVLLKAGVSDRGAMAAASHTGALAGSDAGIRALCMQTGIQRAVSMQDFTDMLCALHTQPALQSDRIAVVTNAGGPGILATDAADAAALTLATFSPDTSRALRACLPASAGTGNPVDVIGDADAQRYRDALTLLRDDTNVDGICVLLTPQVMTPCEEIAKAVIEVMRTAPLMPVTAAFMGGDSIQTATQLLRAAGVPVFGTPERAIRALASLRRPVRRKPPPAEHPSAQNTLLASAPAGLLSPEATHTLFSAYNLPAPDASVATSADEAASIATRLGYPVIAKISSKDILHKTDVGGVRANLRTEQGVRQAYDDILRNVAAKAEGSPVVDGILIQKFLPAGNECIVGMVRDPSFGPLIMVGLGGIYTELFADTAYRIAPVTAEDAYHMLASLKAWKLLLGMRGAAQSDIDALATLVVSVGRMAMEQPRLQELDLNPVLVSNSGVMIADAKVVLSG